MKLATPRWWYVRERPAMPVTRLVLTPIGWIAALNKAGEVALLSTAPERADHQGFVKAGSDLILTNSFGGTRYRLKLHGHQDRVRELNLAAARARGAANPVPRPAGAPPPPMMLPGKSSMPVSRQLMPRMCESPSPRTRLFTPLSVSSLSLNGSKGLRIGFSVNFARKTMPRMSSTRSMTRSPAPTSKA